MKYFAALTVAAAAFPAATLADTLPICGAYPVGQESYACTCPSQPAMGAVWGSGPYTADSNICIAALHAGVITLIGGPVLVVAEEGQEAYGSSVANGIETRPWGAYGTSFVFDPKGPRFTAAMTAPACERFDVSQERVTCHCSGVGGAGSVWGSGPYTADSDLCTAATHSGILNGQPRDITVVRMPGLESYAGTEHNGVTTRDWGSYSDSIVIFAAD